MSKYLSYGPENVMAVAATTKSTLLKKASKRKKYGKKK